MLIELVAIALAFSASGGQSAPGIDQQLTVISTVWTKPDKCNSILAMRVEFATLAKAPQTWTGKCVAVDGYWRHQALFASKRDAQGRYAQAPFTGRDRRIGIYGTDQVLASAPRQPIRYTAVGLVGQCEDLSKDATFVSGYCHYFFGPYIAVAEMHRR
jgi:hypothetical protein